MAYRQSRGNILQSRADLVCIPVNTVGVAGAGLALQFKQRFPSAYLAYRNACQRKLLRIGHIILHDGFVFFPTKQHWRHPSQLIFVEVGLDNLASQLRQRADVRTVALPKLGCGLGQLPWKDVQPLIQNFAKVLDTMGIDVVQY